MNFPATMKVKDLIVTHPDYDGEEIDKIDVFCEGGKRFAKNRHKYLIPRQSDKNAEYKASRLRCAFYDPSLARIINGHVRTILKDPPTIELDKSVKPDDPRAEYWNNLVKNVDGSGESLEHLCESRLQEMMKHERAYLTMISPDVEAVEGETVAQAKESKRLDWGICYQNAANVDDWDTTDDGELVMVRTHAMVYARTSDTGPVDTERHIWTYITSDEIIHYMADFKLGTGSLTEQNVGDTEAKRKETNNEGLHGLNFLPIFKITVPEGLSLGTYLIEPMEDLWNMLASETFAIHAGAINKPILETDNASNADASLNQLLAVVVPLGGDFRWASPPGEVFTALSAAIESRRKRLEEGARSQEDKALQTHQSGTAISAKKSPRMAFLALYANGLKHDLQVIIDRIAKLRNEEDLKPTVCGMEDFEDNAEQIDAQTLVTLLTIPDLPPELQAALFIMLAKAHTDMDADSLDKMQKQLKEAAENKKAMQAAALDKAQNPPVAPPEQNKFNPPPKGAA